MKSIHGHLITTWQKCKRRYKLESIYRYQKWFANTLLSAVLRKAIYQLSDPNTQLTTQQISTQAVSLFTQQCRQPGLLQTEGINVYDLAMDYVAMIKTIIEYFSRISLPITHSISPTKLDSNYQWSYLSQIDESNTLHRYRFIDFINESSITSEAHSWEVAGDLAYSESPMMLHLISIGRRIDSRHVSPWCRAYASPGIRGVIKFQKKSGNDLSSNWKPIYFADNIDSDPESWVDQLQEDQLDQVLVQHIHLNKLESVHVLDLQQQVRDELANMEFWESRTWSQSPMHRASCDKPYACPHQELCYSLNPDEELKNSGLYEVIK